MNLPEAQPVPYPPVDGTQPCAAEEPELFFPRTSRDQYFSEPRAKAVCEHCPFFTPCLEWAVAHNTDGLWAGTSPAERAAIRARRGVTAIPLRLHI